MENKIEGENQINNTSNESKKSRFKTILYFVLFFLLGSLGIASYFLFISSRSTTDSFVKIEERFISSSETFIDYRKVFKENQKYLVTFLTKDKKPIANGVVVSSNGLIMTTYTFSPKDTGVIVRTTEGNEFEIQNIYNDPKSNLKIVRINSSNLTVAKFPNELDVEPGLEVSITGSSDILDNFYSSKGLITLKKDNLLLTSIIYPKGFSGSGLFDRNSNLVGLYTINESNFVEAVSFINIRQFLEEYLSTQDREKVDLGITYKFDNLKNYLDQNKPIGPVIIDVEKDSISSKEGLKVDDIILSINNQEFTSSDELTEYITSLKGDEELKIVVFRDNKRVQVTLNLRN